MQLNILLLCNKPKAGNDANTIVDHIEAIEQYSTHKIWLYSNLGDLSSTLNLNKFDVVIIHYSLSLIYNHFLSDQAKKQIRAFNGLKVVFIQDEYRQINKVISQLQFLKIDVLFTCFPESEMEKIYNKQDLPDLSLYNNLTGYIPERLLKLSNPTLTPQRPLHIGYRGRKIPFWLGELAFEKWDIVEKWKRFVTNPSIKTDMSYHESDRIYGKKWQDFLLSCKATLGVESGASVMDFTGELEKTIDLYQLTHPLAPFSEVQELFLKEHEGLYKLNQISPRCFEAIALKTVLILYEGEYSGILTPWRHYIPLKKDYSNIEEVLTKLQDDAYLQNMADIAYADIALNPVYTYQHFIETVNEVITDEWLHRKGQTVDNSYCQESFEKVIINKPIKCYTPEAFEKAINHIPIKKKIYQICLAIYYKLPRKLQLVVKVLLQPKMIYFYIGVRVKRLFLKFGILKSS